mgnify:CR=1 FL=1
MSGWTADFANDPFDDYNLIVEILFNDEDVAVIKQGKDGLEMKWYATDKDIIIPVEWLNGCKRWNVVGKPKSGMFNGSPHEQLAQSINADTSTVVGGMFKRGTNGEILTNEFSGHYWQNWTADVRQQFVNTMNQYGIKITHSEGMLP